MIFTHVMCQMGGSNGRYITHPNSLQQRDRFADVGGRPALSGALTSFADKAKEGSYPCPALRTEEKYPRQRFPRGHVNWNPLVGEGG